MRHLRIRKLLLATTLGLALVAPVAGPTADAPPAWDGLVLTPTRGLDAVYLRPGAPVTAYRTVHLQDPVAVAFNRDWERSATTESRGRRLSADDLQRIRTDMATEFRKVFTDRLAKGGYALVDRVAEDTLDIAVSLTDIRINAPDTQSAGRSMSFTMEAGRITLVMLLADGPTGELLARVVDTRSGNTTGRVSVSNSVTNSAEFRRVVRSWSDRLVKALDGVRNRTP